MDTTAIILLLASFFIMIILGFHISYAMMASAGITILYLGLSPTQIINTMVDSVDGFTFLAIPFFILSGDIMAHGGISDRLILLADALVGWMRGGLAMVNVMASIFFGGISGSATADTASLGAILILSLIHISMKRNCGMQCRPRRHTAYPELCGSLQKGSRRA